MSAIGSPRSQTSASFPLVRSHDNRMKERERGREGEGEGGRDYRLKMGGVSVMQDGKQAHPLSRPAYVHTPRWPW